MPALVPGAPPAPPATLLGRDEPRARLTAALKPGTVTALVGPPGVGKSTLAAAVAHERAPAVWADLSAATTPADLWGALGAALSVPLDAVDQAHARLAGVLARRATPLVVLDAAEHLYADAWAEVERLARAAPAAAWLVTSVVRPAGSARVLELGPLAEADAVALLLARARDRALDAPPDPADPAWSALAERLSGLPLALELAAGRFGVLTAAQILERLDRPRLLAGGRHGSVEGALRYAWDLLGEADRAALVTCAVFRGGFDLAAAERVLGDDALERLTALRERSALAWRDGRFHVLDGLRRVAEAEGGARLLEARARHAAWYARLAEDLAHAWRGPDAAAALAALVAERPNFRAAWEYAREVAPAHAAGAATGFLVSVRRGGPPWAADALGDVTPLARAVGGAVGADLLTEAGRLAWLRARRDAAQALFDEALALAEAAGSASARREALLGLSRAATEARDAAAARALAERIAEAATDDFERGMACNTLAVWEAIFGDKHRAAEHFEAGVRALDAAGATCEVANARANLAILRKMQRRYAEARALYEAALAVLVPTSPNAALGFYVDLVALHLLDGRPDAAAATLRDAEALQRRIARPGFDASLAAWGATLRWAAGDHAGAREQLGRALTLPPAYPAALANTRAFLAALDAGPNQRADLEAARAAGADPGLVAVLDAAAAGEPPPPVPPFESSVAQVARLLVAGAAAPSWKVDTDGRWFERPSGRVDLSRRGALRRILAALATARRERPSVGLSVDEVFAAGWPGEHVLPEAAAGRVYTAIRELRSLGLESVLQRQAEGYLLDPAVGLALV